MSSRTLTPIDFDVVRKCVLQERWDELRSQFKRNRDMLPQDERWKLLVFVNELIQQTGKRP